VVGIQYFMSLSRVPVKGPAKVGAHLYPICRQARGIVGRVGQPKVARDPTSQKGRWIADGQASAKRADVAPAHQLKQGVKVFHLSCLLSPQR
jgi:hypothetical protein